MSREDGQSPAGTRPVVLFGSGPIAEVVHYYLTHDSPYTVAGFTVDQSHRSGAVFLGLPVVPFEDVRSTFPPATHDMFIAVGYSRMNGLREAKFREAKSLGYRLISYVSSKATVWPAASLGDNCFVMEGVIVHPFVNIGDDVIIWSGSHIGHGSVVGDHCFISSRTAISGLVTVESNCFFGTNATVRDQVTIARGCVIGAGAVILKSTVEWGVYVADGARLLPIPSGRLPNL